MNDLFARIKQWLTKNNSSARKAFSKNQPQLESLENRELLAAQPLSNAPDVNFQVADDWNSAHRAELTLTNDEGTSFSNWQLEFNYDGTITQLWHGELENLGGGRYRVTPPSWNDTLDAGESLTIGFIANGPGTQPSGYSFNGSGTTEPTLPTVSISSATLPEGDSGTSLATFTVSLSAAATEAVQVNYQATSGTATLGDDFEPTTGQIEFAVGETTKTISVPVNGDTQTEDNEVFYITLSSPVGAVLDTGAATGTGTILNDDTAMVDETISVTTAFQTSVTLNTVGGDPDFGTHLQAYTEGTLLPSQYTQAELDELVGDYYDRWKADWLRVDPGGNGYRVIMDGSGRTVSEGQGYGMMIVAHMDGYDPQAQAIFDGLFNYVRDNPSESNPDLMDWAQPDPSGNSSAFDGDADIAYGLLLADAQWGSDGNINYLAEAIRIIDAMYESTIGPQSHLPMLGDWVNPNGGQYSQWTTRTSDFMYGHFRAFEAATGDSRWGEVITATQEVVTKLQQQYGTGLVPDFVIVDPNTGDVSPAPSGFLEQNDNRYWYNAGRVPWRYGTDAVLSGDPTSVAQAQKLSEFFQQSSGGNPSQILGGYELDGTPLNPWSDPFFRATVGVSAMTGIDAADQQWLNAVFDSVATTHTNYYSDSVSILSLLVLSGNFFDPSNLGGAGGVLTSFTQATAGSVTGDGDGTITYSPNAEFSGTDSFTYTVLDNAGATTVTTVNVTVTPANADVLVSVGNATQAEGNSGTSQAVFAISLNKPATAPITVSYETRNGTATAGADYQATTEQVVFQVGETTKTVAVPVLGDTTIESNENFQLVLTSTSSGAIATPVGTGTIVDDDSPAPTSEVNFSVVNDWNSGFQGAIEVENSSQETWQNWTLEFTFAGEITDIWNAEIVSHVGNTYVIRGASWNRDVAPGQAISFGFVAQPGGIAKPFSNYLLNGSPL